MGIRIDHEGKVGFLAMIKPINQVRDQQISTRDFSFMPLRDMGVYWQLELQ